MNGEVGGCVGWDEWIEMVDKVKILRKLEGGLGRSCRVVTFGKYYPSP